MAISPRQFEALQARVRANRTSPIRTPEPIGQTVNVKQGSSHRVVLGIDPSLRGTGWGIIRLERGQLRALGWGTLKCSPSLPRTQCLARIAAGLREAIQSHHPTACAIEALFYAQNLQTALLMGEARGVCLLAAAEAGIETCEIAPRRMKQAMVGFGGAQKSAVGRMVERMLRLSEPPDPDAADALALALVHAQDLSRPSLAPLRRL